MQEEDKYLNFVETLSELETIFNCNYTEEKLKLFWRIFKRYKLRVIKNAVNYLLRFRKVNYEVLPGEIEQAIINYKEDERFMNDIIE